ncbi:MAG: undecaprenyl-diphosphate phosphatase [Flavobacteriales bacterium]|nr:undecaprenyl-diphosphate phosphatase [Flavobacteriales bacterium]MCB9449728.1 undecaprenyl-diphosphate phosphatase [Flavobacteriales bacterium]
MSVLQALILGLLQGLTEFLPISSSGHIEIGKALLNVPYTEDLTFTIVVHGATVLSTIVFFRKDILHLLKQGLAFKWNPETAYIVNLGISMVPVGVIGLLYKDELEKLAIGNVPLVGGMLLITGVLLLMTRYIGSSTKEINPLRAFVIGVSQAIAVMPGISRSGATIGTALLMGVKKETAARFSFLMVLVPIIGANLKSMADGEFSHQASVTPLVVGFIAAFVSGLLACKWMLGIVRHGKLTWFAVYCFVVGTLSMIFG